MCWSLFYELHEYYMILWLLFNECSLNEFQFELMTIVTNNFYTTFDLYHVWCWTNLANELCFIDVHIPFIPSLEALNLLDSIINFDTFNRVFHICVFRSSIHSDSINDISNRVHLLLKYFIGPICINDSLNFRKPVLNTLWYSLFIAFIRCCLKHSLNSFNVLWF